MYSQLAEEKVLPETRHSEINDICHGGMQTWAKKRDVFWEASFHIRYINMMSILQGSRSKRKAKNKKQSTPVHPRTGDDLLAAIPVLETEGKTSPTLQKLQQERQHRLEA